MTGTPRRSRTRSFGLDALRPAEGPIGLDWLIRLRWVAMIAQVLTVAFALPMLHAPIVTVPLLTLVVLVLAAANVVATNVRDQEVDADHRLLTHLAIDVIALSAFFELAGGGENPFTSLFLIHVAMGAIVLSPRRAVTLGGIVVGCYAVVSLVHLPLHWEAHPIDESTLRQGGQLLAFCLTVAAVGTFALGLAQSLRDHRQQLLVARDQTARTDRLRSVGTLAAGAAHELNTPLSTIQMRVSRLMRRHGDVSKADLDVIREQLDRCKRVVEQLLVGAGDPSASGLDRTVLAELVVDAVDLWQHGSDAEVTLVDESGGAQADVPRVAFTLGLINLLENAREAQTESGVTARLRVSLVRDKGAVKVEVADQGIGLPSAADQVGEPFFTTKDSGTGLGVYVARAVAEGSGGGLTYRANDTAGTVASWWFPIAAG